METFIVLLLISLVYACIAAYNIKGKDSQITGAFLAQCCFCYYLAFSASVADLMSTILCWNLGLLLSCGIGGGIGVIVAEHVELEGKRRTVGYWLHLALANIIILIIGIIFLILSL